jgi:hypothetical protein
MPKKALQFAVEPFKYNNLKPVLGTRRSSARLGQAPLGVPVYGSHDTYAVISVNRGVSETAPRRQAGEPQRGV